MEIAFIGQEHKLTHYESAISYNFRVLEGWRGSDAEMFSDFLKNEIFFEICFQERENGVGPVFDYGIVRTEDFTILDKNGFYKYLSDYFENAEWSEYHIEDIKPNLAWLKNDIDRCKLSTFFVLNMESFEQNNKVIRQFQRSIYLCYFIAVFWFERENFLVTYTELFWD